MDEVVYPDAVVCTDTILSHIVDRADEFMSPRQEKPMESHPARVSSKRWSQYILDTLIIKATTSVFQKGEHSCHANGPWQALERSVLLSIIHDVY